MSSVLHATCTCGIGVISQLRSKFTSYVTSVHSEEMNEDNSTFHHSCWSNFTGDFSIALLIVALPFHLFIMRVLAFNLRFENPRHIILFCLSASDSMQLAVTALVILIIKFEDTARGTAACKSLRDTLIFTTGLTYIVSSLTLVVLSAERYIACFHSYRVHVWLTRERVIAALSGCWASGAIGGGIAIIPDARESNQVVLKDSWCFRVIFVTITLAVSCILIVVQSMLLWLSRKKFRSIQPSSSSSSISEEVPNVRKRKVQTAVAASIVFLSYSICMLPGALLIIVKSSTENPEASYVTDMSVITLGMLNTVLNPFIYGLGMQDTRRAMLAELKKVKSFFLIKFRLQSEFDA